MESETEFDDTVPIDILEEAHEININLLPKKSKQEYIKEYNKFKEWRKTRKTSSFAEEVFQVYVKELAKKYSPPTVWSKYSKIKGCVRAYDNIDMSKYGKINVFLKDLMADHVPVQAKVFTPEEITKFINEAPDSSYLDVKVRVIIK